METVELVGRVLFSGAWLVAMASLLYSLYEFFAMNRLAPSVFRQGITVLNECDTISIDPAKVAAGQIQTGGSGKFRFISTKECLFCPRYRFFTWRTPFPIKGRIQWENGIAKIEGRIPVSTTIFLAAWFVGWVAAGLAYVSADIISGLAPAVLGGGIAAVLFLLSIPLELRRARAIVHDIKES
jgi:hypothetical protein